MNASNQIMLGILKAVGVIVGLLVLFAMLAIAIPNFQEARKKAQARESGNQTGNRPATVAKPPAK